MTAAPKLQPPKFTNSPETEQAYANSPEHMRAEIVHDMVMMSPRPDADHANVVAELASILRAPFQRGRGGPGGWIILPEPELHLGAGPDKISPDFAGWKRERMPERPRTAAISLAPEWICEILSPSTEEHDRGTKMPVYARENVQHVWIIDSKNAVLEVFKHMQGTLRPFATFRGNAIEKIEPFDAIEFDLGLLWTW